MTNFRTLTAATAILGACTLMSGAALAQSGDINCGEYSKMDAGAQRSAARAHMDKITNAGPEAEREAEQPDAVMSTDTGVETMETGKDARDARARSDEDSMMSAMAEHCKGGEDLLIKDTPSRAEQGAAVE